MRVMVIGRFTSIHTVRFSEELQRQGIEVAALWIGPSKTTPNVHVYHAEGDMRIFGIPRTATLGCLLYIRRAIRSFRPDIIHVQDDPRMPFWLRLIGPSNIITAYTNWGHNSELTDQRTFRSAIADTDLLTSDAPDVLEELTRVSPNARREIVRFGADTQSFSPGQPDAAILEKYGLDPGGLYVLSPRSLRPNYNQLTLIRGLYPVMEIYPNLTLILKHHHVDNYSDSYDYQNQLRSEAQRLRIWHRIIRLDHLPYSHLCHLYRLCRVAVSIPFEDGFPATIFEAMACGCPLIVSDDRSYDGVVVDGVNSIAIPPTDTTALSAALMRLLADSTFADKIRQEAFKTVSEKGNFKQEISRLTHIYQSLIHARSM